MSPFFDQVQQTTMAWADHFNLVRSGRAHERLNRLQYGSFMARAYPTASEPSLRLFADWNTWLFLLDDEFDERAFGRQPDRLAQLHARLLAILRGARPSADDDTRYHALHDLTKRFDAAAPAGWMRRFIDCVEATFAASVWEAHNRKQLRTPGEAEYLDMRPFTSAVYCFLCFIEIAEQLSLPSNVRRSAPIRALSHMTNNAISWFNDLISYPKEIARGDVHNLVYIVHRERNISVEDAAAYVVYKHNAEVEAFQHASVALRCCGDPGAQKYVAGLQAWIRANVDWSIATARYRPADSSALQTCYQYDLRV